MLIDYKTLSDEALKGVCEQYVVTHLSETEQDPKYSGWVDSVIEKVKSGELIIEFSEVDESVTLKSRDEVFVDGKDG
ncbi:YheU family protein [Aliikangiella coralliicola]|uniref:YheU family protein n=1 Tax=Aliikangiella coralliicola TaxID=2592383 RepID=A0A545U4X9_9GAMM|nr:YheU family protein [Aliikangiella coralliicola]TQV84526.1 YheU family protein [Aliikangiella coralliicola]